MKKPVDNDKNGIEKNGFKDVISILNKIIYHKY